jgi:formylglycine-generating enzyme required for sulfatase activity
MLYCETTGQTGSVRDPSKEEWAKAYNAPSNPYRWHDESRVFTNDTR